MREEDDITGQGVTGDGIKELQSWYWNYGQTPEFTYSLSRTFDWGSAVIHPRDNNLNINVILSGDDSPLQTWNHFIKFYSHQWFRCRLDTNDEQDAGLTLRFCRGAETQ